MVCRSAATIRRPFPGVVIVTSLLSFCPRGWVMRGQRSGMGARVPDAGSRHPGVLEDADQVLLDTVVAALCPAFAWSHDSQLGCRRTRGAGRPHAGTHRGVDVVAPEGGVEV